MNAERRPDVELLVTRVPAEVRAVKRRKEPVRAGVTGHERKQ
jgi:hypothetical protein